MSVVFAATNEGPGSPTPGQDVGYGILNWAIMEATAGGAAALGDRQRNTLAVVPNEMLGGSPNGAITVIEE